MNQVKSIIASLLLLIPAAAVAQEAQETEEKAEGLEVREQPRHHFIEMFRPLYIVSGIPVTERPDKENADVKFQVSLEIPLWRDMRGSGIDLSVAYTQISLWNLYANSSPFYDNAYIPGLYCRKVWSGKDGQPKHTVLWGIEHRSNGRSDAYSRSINYALATYARSYPCGLVLEASARVGFGWYGDQFTWDVGLKYHGFLQGSLTYTTPSGGWEFMASVSPIWNRHIANVNAEIGRRIGKKHDNPYLFVQFHYGYDEAFRDCIDVNGPVIDDDGKVPYSAAAPAAPRAFIRFGVLITPHSFMRGNL